MNISLRQRLLVFLTSTTLVAWVVVSVVSVSRTRAEVEELFDAKLAQSAWVLLTLTGHELLEEGAGESSGRFVDERERLEEVASHLGSHKYESPVAFQIWLRGGAFRFHSANAPSEAFSHQGDGFSDITLNGVTWRVFTRTDERLGIIVRYAERRQVREELVNQIAWQFLLPLILGVPILAAIVWQSVAAGIRPLGTIASAVARRDPAHLERLDTDRVPSEVLPLVAALNDLFGRLERAYERERLFTADAAHELRSPLTAIRTQAEVALSELEAARRRQALDQLIRSVDRATHLVQQLLTLARVDPEAAVAQFVDVDLHTLVRDVGADLAADAVRKDIELTVDAMPVSVRGDVDALRLLVRNLLDNAIRYTPAGGRVALRTQQHRDGDVTLVVSDSGPGIPEDQFEAVFRRFYRRGGNRTTGSGLGLSIVKRIADLHGASIRLGRSVHGGLEACVRLSGARSATR